MASIGHVAVGMAAARIYSPVRSPLRTLAVSVLVWSAVSLLPDADVVGFSLGVRYEAPWGHRGATHSFAFAALIGAGAGAIAAGLRLPPVRTGGLVIGVLASHPLLDTLTDGGLGCALFWPFDLTRYFAPWNPIPVAPIGLAFFSPFGLAVAAVEFVQFSPLFAWAWSPDGFRALWARHRVMVVMWMSIVLVLVSPLSGSIRETATGLVLREDTEYAVGFSERKLDQVARGAPEESVRGLLGEPLQLAWAYQTEQPDPCTLLFVDGGRLAMAMPPGGCAGRGVQPGQAAEDARLILGEPATVCWLYTRSPTKRVYRLRAVCFANRVVEQVMRLWWED